VLSVKLELIPNELEPEFRRIVLPFLFTVDETVSSTFLRKVGT
jgi:hypothetical protein